MHNQAARATFQNLHPCFCRIYRVDAMMQSLYGTAAGRRQCFCFVLLLQTENRVRGVFKVKKKNPPS